MLNANQEVRFARQAAGLTQKQLSTAAGLHRIRLCNFEGGYGTLQPAELDRVWRVLHRHGQRRLVPLASLTTCPPPPAARKLYRQRVGLTQQELARRIGMSQSKLSDFERGVQQLTPHQWVRWKAAVQATGQPAIPSLEERNTVLEEMVANLKQQLAKTEQMLLNQEEVTTLQHGMIETLKEQLKRLTTPEEFARIEAMEGVGY